MFSIAADIRNTLGECPLWCEITRRLYWTDIESSELLALEESNDAVMRWSLPERLGSFALTDRSHILLMGLESRLALYDLNTGFLSTIAASPGGSDTRIGDGRCDRSSNFVFGTMDDGFPAKVIGKFHRLNAATLTVETLALPDVAIPNSICFSPDGGTLYYCDSMQGRIMCCDYPSLQNQRVFTTIEGEGAPDGSCVDAMGYLWNAEWGGSRVVRYRPDGTRDAILSSPGIQSTCPVLAGENFARLYCTTASMGLTTVSENDGKLQKAKSDVSSGLPENRFTANIF